VLLVLALEFKPNPTEPLKINPPPVQGSGWGWLAYNKASGGLDIVTTANQDPCSTTVWACMGDVDRGMWRAEQAGVCTPSLAPWVLAKWCLLRLLLATSTSDLPCSLLPAFLQGTTPLLGIDVWEHACGYLLPPLGGAANGMEACCELFPRAHLPT